MLKPLRHDARVETVPYIFRGSHILGSRAGAVLRLLAGVGLANVLLLAYFTGCVLVTHLLG